MCVFFGFQQDGEGDCSCITAGILHTYRLREGQLHAATAGAQIPNTTVKEVLSRLTASIDRFYEM